MNLSLTPNEYMETSREVYETALAYQSARTKGIEKAREEHKEREKKQRESQERLKEKVGR